MEVIDATEFAVKTHNGKITIHNPETGNQRTFRIKTQKDDANFAPGERIVSLLVGSDNQSSYKGFGFVLPGGRVVVWKKNRGTVYERYARLLQNLKEESERFGLTVQFSVKCRKCNKELTDEKSIRLGIGPTCRGEK